MCQKNIGALPVRPILFSSEMRIFKGRRVLECTECDDTFIRLGTDDGHTDIRSAIRLKPTMTINGQPMQGRCPNH